MSNARQKEFERMMVEGFLRRSGIDAQVLEGNFEAPDQVVLYGERRIGIEVTEIQKGHQERANQSKVRDLVEKARFAYIATASVPISVWLSMTHSYSLESVDRRGLATSLAEYLSTLVGDDEAVVVRGAQLPSDLRQYFSGITLVKDQECNWFPVEATSVASFTVELFHERIEAKAGRLDEYRLKGYDDYWLLICAQPLNPACRFDHHVDFDPAAVKSTFSRTFFYDGWHCFELGVE